jgi:hypothetical protein
VLLQNTSDPTPAKRPPGLLVFGLIWTAFSSIFVVIGLGITWKAMKVGAWDKVPCEIERFEIRHDLKKDPVFTPDLVFRYEIDGRRYQGTRLWPDKKGSDDHEDLAEIRESLALGPEGPRESPAGTVAECRVNPADPSDAVLRGKGFADLLGGLAFALFGGFFVLIGIGLMFGKMQGAGARAKSSGSTKEAPPFVVLVFFSLFGLVGLGVLGGLVLPKALEWAAMRGWQATPAEVIWSRVRSKSDSDGTTYAVDLFYRYQVGGREYRSNRYDLMGGSSSGRSGKLEVVRAHPAKSRLEVYVDPAKPWRAVVRRDLGWGALFALFPLPFLAFGVGGLWWFFRRRNQGPSVSRPQPSRPMAARRGGMALVKTPPPAVAGQWIKVGDKRKANFVALVVMALFWNGIISFGVRDALGGLIGESLVERAFGSFFGLFMIPFVLVGIGLAVGALYSFAAIFGPRYEIQLGESELAPGQSTSILWRRAGGHGQPRDFMLLLVGSEEATWSQGSSNTTARSVFHEQVLFETTVPLAMEQGRVELRIPDDGVPSFRGRHNKLCWLLCLRASVPRLPDLRDKREITVRALAKEELP